MKTQCTRSAALGAGATLLAAGVLLIGALAGPVQAATAPVPLGTAASFSVLAGSGITNTGPTTVFGDIGSFPTTDITGASDITIGGVNHGGDGVTQDAKKDLVTAYNTAAGALPPHAVTADLGGSTLVPGVYKAVTAMGLTGALTLDAGGDPNAVFIFQAGSTLTTASDSSVVLLNGAQACNIFWQVGSSATIGTRTALRGNVLAYTSITAETDATVEGRLLASNGAVTLHSNVLSRPGCDTTTLPTGGETTPVNAGGGGVTPSTGVATGHPSARPTSLRPATATATAKAAATARPRATSSAGSYSAGDHSGSTDTRGRLPDTGGPSESLLVAGLLAVALGTAGLTASRLRRRHSQV